jgi:hypothetical protein
MTRAALSSLTLAIAYLPLDCLAGSLDYPEFLKCLLSGLADHPDVRAPAHHMLARTAAVAPGAVLAQVRG